MDNIELPLLPAVAMKVSEAAADPEKSAANLASIIEQDVSLTAEILRAVNSSFYSPRTKISSVQRAVSFMGSHMVRYLILCLAVRKLFKVTADFPLELFWECSLRRAAGSRCLARRLGLPKIDEIFTLSLCQDLGILVQVQQTPKLGPKFAAWLRLPSAERLELEHQIGLSHDEIAFNLFIKWNFPEELAVPVRYHHQPKAAPTIHSQRAAIAYAAESLADLLEVDDKVNSWQLAEDQLLELGIHKEAISPLIDEITKTVNLAADLLQLHIRKQPSYEEIAMIASNSLLHLGLSSFDVNRHLQRSLTEQQCLAEKLKQLTTELSERATTDSLTSLPNRRAFDASLELELARAKRYRVPLSLALLDIDHFKRFNDTYGHQAGDLVLQHMAYVIKDTVRKADFPARYGGEEFAVIMPYTASPGAWIAAERLREKVETLDVPWEGRKLKITTSIGCTTIIHPDDTYVTIVKRADEALYKAKELGRNRVVMI